MSNGAKDTTPLAKVVRNNMLRHIARMTTTGISIDTNAPASRDDLDKAVRAICDSSLDAIEKAFAKKAKRPPYAREALESAFGLRWNASFSSVRAFDVARRIPTWPKNKAFFDDVREYGAAEFSAAGVILKKSLGRGPSRDEFDLSVGHARRSRRAA